MSDQKEIDFSSIENMIALQLENLAARRAALKAELAELDERENVFRSNIRYLLNGVSRGKPEAPSTALGTIKKSKRQTLLSAAIVVLQERKTYMTRGEIADAIKQRFPDEFTDVNVSSLYPFLREIARRPGFTLDKTKKRFLYTGENGENSDVGQFPDPFAPAPARGTIAA